MKKLKYTREKLLLALIVILSAVLNFANLSIEGYANQYYAAGVKSMTMSLKNFFFVSFDPSGFVSIDKPPLGFWIQAISAKIFGYSGWSIILPQAIAGVISVIVLYCIVKRSFGSVAALISALCLAVTPVFVAVSRNNTIDNLLVLTLLFACWAMSKAAEKGKVKYLLLSLAIVGVGFNIKMLQAYMIVPALYIMYLLSNAVSIKKRLIHLVAGTVILVMVSLSWAVVVDLIPASSRPFVGSSTNNSVIELVLGHNGLERLTSSNGSGNGKRQGTPPSGKMQGGPGNSSSGSNQGMPGNPPNGNMQGGPGNQSSSNNAQSRTGNTSNSSTNINNQRQGMPGGGPNGNNKNEMKGQGGGQGGTFGGSETASITRLFSNNSLSDQIIWLFPIAIFGFIAAAIKEKLKFPFNNKRKQALMLWIMWLLPEFIYFSYTKGLFHPYYLTMLAAPIAALTGIGIVSMWDLHKEGGWKSWILPTAFIVNGLAQLLILSYYYSTSSLVKILMVVVSLLCFAASIILIILNLSKNKENENPKLKKVLVGIALAGLLIVPTVWSGTTMFYAMSGTFPSAGIELASSNKGMDNTLGNGNSKANTNNNNTDQSNDSTAKLVKYLKANTTNEKYLVAVPSAMGYASDIIIKYGESVMTLGGFSGSDNILTLNEFKQLVKSGAVRYAIINGGGAPGGTNTITSWIKQNGKAVSQSEWSGTTKSSSVKNQIGGGFGGGNSIQLYDLKSAVK